MICIYVSLDCAENTTVLVIYESSRTIMSTNWYVGVRNLTDNNSMSTSTTWTQIL